VPSTPEWRTFSVGGATLDICPSCVFIFDRIFKNGFMCSIFDALEPRKDAWGEMIQSAIDGLKGGSLVSEYIPRFAFPEEITRRLQAMGFQRGDKIPQWATQLAMEGAACEVVRIGGEP